MLRIGKVKDPVIVHNIDSFSNIYSLHNWTVHIPGHLPTYIFLILLRLFFNYNIYNK